MADGTEHLIMCALAIFRAVFACFLIKVFAFLYL